ncbi:sigma-E processing peptidase SpoIIGA [Bacillus sp. 31A1R]|uniref:Sigma-E processing peptidase SpoIIGA n=1 Tax=Robertmurraya mangrovi TaxID=3098077 RepID=A0ABU5IU87_9BACI|nr:sigma-E processing peptidase SpoIIGA [Bacillus sp. 31A1R]MDZ5470710.1 sigma-E processing peptidase SpoIIGA [Bacillus sp. 31A1R]
MTVYLDIIWALNFLFDSLLLYLTAIILKRDFKYWRVFTGGFIGSIIILLTFTPFNDYSGHPLVKLLFSVVMVFVVFGYKRLRYFISNLMTFYLTTFLVGGALIGTHYFVQFDYQLSSSVLLASVHGFGDPISWLFVILGFPIAWHFSKTNIENIEMTKIRYDQLLDVCVCIEGNKLRFKGLIDSGNQLYDPISKMPVMFVSIANLGDDLPDVITRLASEPDSIILGEESISPEWENKMRIIPYKVVGQEHQLIIAVKPDEIIFEKENETLLVEKGLVSFTKQQLSSDDAFQCIVHPKMLTTTKKVQTHSKVS